MNERPGLVVKQLARPCPSAAFESAAAVLIRAAGSLHHSIDGDLVVVVRFTVAVPFSLVGVVRLDRTTAPISSVPERRQDLLPLTMVSNVGATFEWPTIGETLRA